MSSAQAPTQIIEVAAAPVRAGKVDAVAHGAGGGYVAGYTETGQRTDRFAYSIAGIGPGGTLDWRRRVGELDERIADLHYAGERISALSVARVDSAGIVGLRVRSYDGAGRPIDSVELVVPPECAAMPKSSLITLANKAGRIVVRYARERAEVHDYWLAEYDVDGSLLETYELPPGGTDRSVVFATEDAYLVQTGKWLYVVEQEDFSLRHHVSARSMDLHGIWHELGQMRGSRFIVPTMLRYGEMAAGLLEFDVRTGEGIFHELPDSYNKVESLHFDEDEGWVVGLGTGSSSELYRFDPSASRFSAIDLGQGAVGNFDFLVHDGPALGTYLVDDLRCPNNSGYCWRGTTTVSVGRPVVFGNEAREPHGPYHSVVSLGDGSLLLSKRHTPSVDRLAKGDSLPRLAESVTLPEGAHFTSGELFDLGPDCGGAAQAYTVRMPDGTREDYVRIYTSEGTRRADVRVEGQLTYAGRDEARGGIVVGLMNRPPNEADETHLRWHDLNGRQISSRRLNDTLPVRFAQAFGKGLLTVSHWSKDWGWKLSRRPRAFSSYVLNAAGDVLSDVGYVGPRSISGYAMHHHQSHGLPVPYSWTTSLTTETGQRDVWAGNIGLSIPMLRRWVGDTLIALSRPRRFGDFYSLAYHEINPTSGWSRLVAEYVDIPENLDFVHFDVTMWSDGPEYYTPEGFPTPNLAPANFTHAIGLHADPRHDITHLAVHFREPQAFVDDPERPELYLVSGALTDWVVTFETRHCVPDKTRLTEVTGRMIADLTPLLIDAERARFEVELPEGLPSGPYVLSIGAASTVITVVR